MPVKAEVLPLVDGDIEAIAAIVREADRDEIEGALGIPIDYAIREGARQGAQKIVINGDVVAVFGCAVHCLLTDVAVPWMVSTVHIEPRFRAFLRISANEVAKMHVKHQTLLNYVDVRNTVAIRWLEWLGFEFSEPEPYGPHGMPFMKFMMERT